MVIGRNTSASIKNLSKFITVLFIVIYICGCGALLAKENEIVMSGGMRITATTGEGTITITAGKGLKRLYTWEGATREVIMLPRYERWYGSFGIYFPGPGKHWKEHNGIIRGVLEEGQQNFDTIDEAITWLNLHRNQNCVYNDEGLVVCFSKAPSRDTINVDVWQIYIGGKTPSKYQEAADGKAAKFFGRSPDEKEIEVIYGGRKGRIYHIDGKKPEKLPGSENEKIKVAYSK